MPDEMRLRFGTSLAMSLFDNLSNKALHASSACFSGGQQARFSCNTPVECLADRSDYLLRGGSHLGCVDYGSHWPGHPNSIADHNVGLAEAPRCRMDRNAGRSGTVTLHSGNGDMNLFGHHVGETKDVERALMRHHDNFFRTGQPSGDYVLEW